MPVNPEPDSTTAIDRTADHARVALPYGSYPPTLGERLADFWENPAVQRTAQIGTVSSGVLLTAAFICWNLLFTGMPKLPQGEELWTINRKPAVQFVDASGDTLAVRGNLYGAVVRGAELPAYVGQAFIAAEDQRFMEHGGVDVQSILRAMLANFSAARTVQGGSTITQQLVKNLLVGDEQTLRRKAQEARLAFEMEATLSKEEILDLYLNRVYLGSNAYGVEAAACAYFGKPAASLSLAEAAFLGALPKAPSRYADDRTGQETTARVHYVLDRMVASGFVTPAAAATAKTQTLSFIEDAPQKPISGYVLDEAMKEAHALLPELPPDAVIALTVDGDLQRRAEAALTAALSKEGLGASEGAIVVMGRDGSIPALVGGRDYQKSQFNRATQALRQPGSAFKTFVYAAALEHGLGPETVRDDAPVQLAGWKPGNYEDNYRGQITLARALAVSSNSVAAQIGSEVGPREIAKIAKRLGIDSPLHAYPSIALGADEVTLLEMTRAYGVIANAGRRNQTHIISEIRDQRGTVLYAAPKADEVQVFAEDAAATLTGMLSNVVRFGTGGQAQIPGWQIAGKTGTSQSWRDAWFVGYSARMVTGVWIGNDDDGATKKVTGGGAAAALFAKVMIAAHRGLKPEPLRGVDLATAWMSLPAIDGAEETGEYAEFDQMGETSQLIGSSSSSLVETAVAPVARPAESTVPAIQPTQRPAVETSTLPTLLVSGFPQESVVGERQQVSEPPPPTIQAPEAPAMLAPLPTQ